MGLGNDTLLSTALPEATKSVLFHLLFVVALVWPGIRFDGEITTIERLEGFSCQASQYSPFDTSLP